MLACEFLKQKTRQRTKFEFENVPIDNSDIVIRNVPKDITMSMAKLFLPSIQEYFGKSDDI